jgi:D-glycero-beta-D-manno-heptose 1-phosphate adenylyltransferase
MSWTTAYQKKVIPPDQLVEHLKTLRAQAKTIATLNGSFDLLHAGHLHIIFEASQQADCLIVALNTDRSIKHYKSPKRPFVALSDRLQLMAALGFVDYVTWFDETDPCELLKIIQPDVHVNGADYGTHCIEADVIKSQGGRLHLVSLVPGLSTSALVHKIQVGA